MDLGIVSIRDLLASASGVGDEPECVSAQPGFAAGVSPERNLPHARLDLLRLAVGRDPAHQHRHSFAAAVFSALASGSQTTPPVSSEIRHGDGGADSSDYTVAYAQLFGIRKVCFHPRQPAAGNAHGQ